MKRAVILAALLMVVVAGTAACSSETGITTTTTTTSSTTATTGTTPAGNDVEWTPDGVITNGEYTGSFQTGSYELSWKSDGEMVYFGIRVETDGWVSLGIQPGDAMKDADIIIGYVDDGTVEVSDHYSTGTFGPHSPDTEQGGTDDILTSGGATDGDYTVIEFSRLLQTGDDLDNDLTAGDNQVIWSYGSSDDTGRQHSNRGYETISL